MKIHRNSPRELENPSKILSESCEKAEERLPSRHTRMLGNAENDEVPGIFRRLLSLFIIPLFFFWPVPLLLFFFFFHNSGTASLEVQPFQLTSSQPLASSSLSSSLLLAPFPPASRQTAGPCCYPFNYLKYQTARGRSGGGARFLLRISLINRKCLC